MCIGGGGGSNRDSIDEQRRAAEESRRNEAERQARLDYGVQNINALFNGQAPDADPLRGYTDFLPEEYRRPEGSGDRAPDGGIYGAAPAAFDASSLQGADWQDGYFGRFEDAYNDFYLPQLDEQFESARSDLGYSLARAGLSRSSAAAEQQADLQRQFTEQRAGLVSNRDEALRGVQDDITQARQGAINQLFSTEDPEIGANVALNSIRTIQSQRPSFDPLGSVFNVASAGFQNVASANRGREALNTIQGASPNSSTGRVIQ